MFLKTGARTSPALAETNRFLRCGSQKGNRGFSRCNVILHGGTEAA
jgi:hypothetical protein